MRILHGFDAPDAYRGGYVSIGNFDGVHRGHQSMVKLLTDRAHAENVPAVVFTFDPHPISILRPEAAPPPLTTTAQKAEIMESLGVDVMIAYPTDQALLDLTPDEFFTRIILGEIGARGLVEGPNFFYGRQRAGNVVTLKRSCDAAGLSLDVVSPVRVGERLVSSSSIRERIAAGDVAAASEMLGRHYRVRGVVSEGARRGRTIGFPTANLAQVATLLPADGVYAGIASVGGNRYAAALNLGPNPTFDEAQRKLEAHLLDFSGDLYGQTLDLEFIARIRDTIRFENLEDLISQLNLDVAATRELAKPELHG